MPRDTKAQQEMRSALNIFMDSALNRAATMATAPKGRNSLDLRKGPRHPYIRFVNATVEKLATAIRASVRESVVALPGRAQKGAVDAACRRAAPIIGRRLGG